MTDLNQPWNPPPKNLKLLENEVHIWRAFLEQPLALIQNLQQFLISEEVTRAQRFYFEKDRNHFIVARGLLRTILGRYLDTDPNQLRFTYNAYGKPALSSPESELGLNFNLSHSHHIA